MISAYPKHIWGWMKRPDIILVQKKLLSVKIGKIFEEGTGVKAIRAETAKSKSELKIFYPFSLESL
jgi:hypothetical protein